MRDGWVEATLREALEPIANRPNGKDYPLVLSVTEKRGIIPQNEIFNHRIATDDISKYKVLEPMDIAYNPYLLWCGAIGQWQGTQAGVVSPVYECFRVKSSCEPRYLGYIFETGILTNYFDALAIGSIVRRRRTIPSDFIAAPVQLPPLSEQKRIVDLISSVDSYIETLRHQLESAKRSRNAVLHELLATGGDDWQQTTLGDIANWGSGGTPKADNPEFYSGDVPWCVIGDLTEREVLKTEKTITKLGLSNSSAKVIAPDSVLLAMYGASIGKTGISAIPMATNQAIAFAKCKTELALPRYLLAYLQSQKSRFVEMGHGAAQPNISQTIIKSWPLTLPPISFQVEVISTIDYFDVHLLNLERSIDSSRAVRSSILSDLLSGDHEIPASYDKLMDIA